MKKFYHFIAKSRLFWLFALTLFLSFDAFSQQARTISGVVKSQGDMELIPGASVLVKGTQRGTVTDIDGVFTLQASDGEILVISFNGFETAEMAVQA